MVFTQCLLLTSLYFPVASGSPVNNGYASHENISWIYQYCVYVYIYIYILILKWIIICYIITIISYILHYTLYSIYYIWYMIWYMIYYILYHMLYSILYYITLYHIILYHMSLMFISKAPGSPPSAPAPRPSSKAQLRCYRRRCWHCSWWRWAPPGPDRNRKKMRYTWLWVDWITNT